jgi:hypothetical protein
VCEAEDAGDIACVDEFVDVDRATHGHTVHPLAAHLTHVRFRPDNPLPYARKISRPGGGGTPRGPAETDRRSRQWQRTPQPSAPRKRSSAQ